jgi:hypothetical protein
LRRATWKKSNSSGLEDRELCTILSNVYTRPNICFLSIQACAGAYALIVAYLLKPRSVKTTKTRCYTTTGKHGTIEGLLGEVFCTRSMPRCYERELRAVWSTLLGKGRAEPLLRVAIAEVQGQYGNRWKPLPDDWWRHSRMMRIKCALVKYKVCGKVRA